MYNACQTRRGSARSSTEDYGQTIGAALQESLGSLADVLEHSTVGVALCDESLRCRMLNSALAAKSGVPAAGYVGKPFREFFGGECPEFEIAFRGVFDAGTSLNNFEFVTQVSTSVNPIRWLANFYPIKDESGQVRLVAVLFSEVTRSSGIEQKLCELIARFFPFDSCDGNEDSAELSTRSLELVKRSLELIKSSMTLRCYVSERRIEAALLRRASFLKLARSHRTSLQLPGAPLRRTRDLCRLHETSPSIREIHVGTLSPRERQLVGLLAEGKSNKQMATILDLSTRTVEAYRARVMTKLKLHSVAEIVRYAVRNNLALT